MKKSASPPPVSYVVVMLMNIDQRGTDMLPRYVLVLSHRGPGDNDSSMVAAEEMNIVGPEHIYVFTQKKKQDQKSLCWFAWSIATNYHFATNELGVVTSDEIQLHH